jgi:hypothetical protein
MSCAALAGIAAVAGVFWWHPAEETIRATPIREAISSAVERHVGYPWVVRRLRVTESPASGREAAPYRIEVEVELMEPTFTALEPVDGITVASTVGTVGFSKRLRGGVWLDAGDAATLHRVEIDNLVTLDRMGTPLSMIPGRVIARGSADFKKWSAERGSGPLAPDDVSSGLCPCLGDRIGEIEQQEDDQWREQDAEHERSDETASAIASNQADQDR